jgi:tRNA threonylcarbamoyladenosine biosynthesis protein TsaE
MPNPIAASPGSARLPGPVRLPEATRLPDAEATRAFAARLAEYLRPGDLLILTGGLGAGKTTFTQGLGTALQVKGQISSPTFIVAREHRALKNGPNLVHVDAYRLGGLEELDALDLDSSLDEAVTVVEWGSGLAEKLNDDHLEIEIARPQGGFVEDENPEAGERLITLKPHGERWTSVDFTPLTSSSS